MRTCNICFKTFERSTSYYNYHKSHKFLDSEYETSLSEGSSTENLNEGLNLKNINEEKVYSSNDEMKDHYKSEASECDEYDSIPIVELPPIASNIVEQEFEMESPILSDYDSQTSDEQDFPNEIYRDFIKLASINILFVKFQ